MKKTFLILLSMMLAIIIVARVPLTVAQDTEEEAVRSLPLDPQLAQVPHRAGPASPAPVAPESAEGPYDWTTLVFETFRDLNWDIYQTSYPGNDAAPLLAGPHAEIQPDLNRGATRVVFASNQTGIFQVYAMNTDGSGLTQLTSGPAENVYPRWSPDGEQILFQSYRDGQSEIYLMDASGGNLRRLTNHPAYDGMPTWSPDGEHIAFVSTRSGPYQIWRMELSSGELRHLATPNTSAYPAWSPNGQYIAYSRDSNVDGWLEVWVMEAADGSGLGQVSDFQGYNSDHYVRAWSPTGDGINYTVVHFIQYQGQWYWTESQQRFINRDFGWDVPFMDGNTDWSLQWQTADNRPPTVAFERPLREQLPRDAVLTWRSQDHGSAGMVRYDLEYQRPGEPMWVPLLQDSTETSAAITVPGSSVKLRLRGRDAGYNYGRWIYYPGALILYEWSASGQVTDNSGTPLQGVLANSSPEPFLNHQSDASGTYSLFSSWLVQSYDLSWQKEGYGQLPDTPVPAPPRDARVSVVLPPADNLLPEGTFEGPSLPPEWHAEGTILAAIDSDRRVTGSAALRLGDPSAATILPESKDVALAAGHSTLSRTLTISSGLQSPRLSFLHQVYGESAGSGLHVQINGTELATVQNATTEWQHASLDVSPWLGETITLTLETAWEEGQSPILAWVDDLTLGSAHPDLALTMNGATNALPGEEVTYNIAIGNRGGPTAPASQLSLELPDGLAFASATPAPDTAGASPTWQLGDLTGGDDYAITLTLAVESDMALLSSLTVAASVVSSSEELQQYNNTVQKSLSVAHPAALPMIWN